jgi:hypothetical protein
VSSAALGQQEERTRVTCHLPINNAAEEKAFKVIIAHLDVVRCQNIGVDGYTYSDPGTFFGRWWSASSADGEWVSDKISLLIIDFRIALTDPVVSLSEKVTELKNVIHQAFAKYDRPQQEVWVVAHRVTRFT